MSIPRFFPYTVKLLNLLKKYEQGVGEQLLRLNRVRGRHLPSPVEVERRRNALPPDGVGARRPATQRSRQLDTALLRLSMLHASGGSAPKPQAMAPKEYSATALCKEA